MNGYSVGIRINATAGNTASSLRGVSDGVRRVGSNATGATRGIRGYTAAQNLLTRGAGFASRGLGALGRMARSSVGAVGGLTRSLVSLQGMLAGVAALAVGGSLFDKLIGGNAQLQGQQLGLAATIGANLKFVDSQGRVLKSSEAFQKSMSVSSQMVEQFRQDALKAPGSSADLIQLFQGAVNPALSAGKSLPEIRQITNEALTFAKVIGNDIPQASRDLQLLLTGNAGMDNRTWQLLASSVGYTAEQFNKLPAPERFRLLSGAFREFATPEVVDAYANSWDGLTSSLGDLIDQTLLVVGGPVFKELSKLIKDAVGYLSDPKNKAEINEFARALGVGIADGIRTLVTVGRTLIKWFTTGQASLEPFLSLLISVGTFLSTKLEPTIAFFGETFSGAFELVSTWFNENQPAINEAWAGFQEIAGAILNVTIMAGGFIALGLGTIITAIGMAVVSVLSRVRAWAAFMGTLPERLAIGFERIKLAFFRMGLGLLENAKKNPILGFLFGLTGIDKAIAALSKAADQMDRALGQREARVQLQQEAADPSNERRQYQATRLLGAMGTGDVTVNVNQQINSSDPQAAGAAAARGTGRAVKGALSSGRTGSDAVEQAGQP
ncbi:MAG: hypothetical protein HC933_05040 [Pleurocapsa sp. SU_196_0]|nr:hypothetical protein [Pleurocapsa sp. SU_196_0]